MASKTDLEISVETLDAMRRVWDGADVYSRDIASRLRAVKNFHPQLIEIGDARMYKGDGTDRMPYFGAILTDLGKRFVNPFFSGTYFGNDAFYIDSASRLDVVKSLSLAACRRALLVDNVQKTVRQAIERRIRKLEREVTS